MKLGDKILYHLLKKPTDEKTAGSSDIQKQEMDGLQYLAGYVVAKS